MLFPETKAVYFDLDDTLCNYWDSAKSGLRTTFAHFGDADVESLISAWAEEFRDFAVEVKEERWYGIYLKEGGQTRTELMRRMLVRTGLDPAKAAAYSDLYLNERQNELALFPEASEVIQKIGKKLPMGLITNGPADIQRLEIERLGIGDHFESILIEGEMGFGKPNPEVMRLAEKAMSASGSEILMVGNSAKHDIRPAQAAGWKTAWVRRASDVAPSSKTGAPETLPEGMKEPDLTMSTLSDLLDHLPLG